MVTWTDSMRNKVCAVWIDQQISYQHNIEMFQLLWIGLSDRWMDVRSVWPFPWTEIKKIVKGVGRSLAISSFKYPIRIQSSAVWPFKYLTVINTSDSLKIETNQIIFFGKKTPIEHATSIFKQLLQMMKCFNIYFLIEINSGSVTHDHINNTIWQGTNH